MADMMDLGIVSRMQILKVPLNLMKMNIHKKIKNPRNAWIPPAVAVILALIPQGNAAVIGPDAFGYKAQNITSTFENIIASGTPALAGTDDSTVSASLGYSFVFYGTSYSSVAISSNGLISFAGTSPEYTNTDLSSINPPSNLPTIAVLWDDWQFFQAGSGAVYYQTLGSPGQRRFIAQWHNTYGFDSSPSSVTFQAVLFEEDNSILFRYLDVDSGDGRSQGAQATIGIANANGNNTGEFVQWSINGTAPVANGEAVHFTIIPEPASTLLSAFGLVCLLVRRQRN